MNKLITFRTFLVLFTFVLAGKTNAQVISDSVSINAGYTHQVFYSMQNGAYPAVDNTNWDIAFQLRGFAASIMINSKNNVQLFKANKSIADWSNMVTADTTGIINSGYELHNSDLTWDLGAFSSTYDTSNQFDLGWGVYDFITHIVSGDSVYFIKLSNGVYKKFLIESLTSGVFYFRSADLDGSNEVTYSLIKSAFPAKFFAYFSIQNNTAIDREPVYNTWDLVFTQYLAIHPILYKVVGVLSNDSVYCAKAYPVDVNTVSPSSYPLDSVINTIGYDWKSYDFSTNAWTLEDSLVYFVQDHNAGLWKMIFTGFGGSANGNYYFTKEYVGVTGIGENTVNPILNIYPNPASGNINLIIAKQQTGNDAVIKICNSMGQIVQTVDTRLTSELNNVNIELNNLNPGFYFLSVIQNGKTHNKPFIIQ